MSTELTDNDIDRLAAEVAERLDHGQQFGEKFVIDRRRLVQLVASGVIGVGALKALSEPASAQAVGQLGDPDNRIDLYGETVDTVTLEAESFNRDQYVGPDGLTTLREAYNNLPSDGGKIYVSNHDETLNESLEIEKPNVSIIGRNAVLRAGWSRDEDGPVIRFARPRCYLSGLEIDGQGDESNNDYADAPGGVIGSGNGGWTGYGFIVENCEIHHCHYATSAAAFEDQIGIFRNNLFRNSRYGGNSNEAWATYQNNTFQNIARNAIKLKSVPNGAVLYNRMSEPNTSGSYSAIKTESDHTKNTTPIIGNRIDGADNRPEGIRTTDGSESDDKGPQLIFANVVRNCTDAAINADRANVLLNTISGCGRGIKASDESRVSYNYVSNWSKATFGGVQVSGDNVVISNNVIEDDPDADDYMYIKGVNITISKNYLNKDTARIRLEGETNDVEIEQSGSPSISDQTASGYGERIVFNGTSTNSGDPSSTGEWDGNEREGITVWDTDNNNLYRYVGGSWRGPLNS